MWSITDPLVMSPFANEVWAMLQLMLQEGRRELEGKWK